MFDRRHCDEVYEKMTGKDSSGISRRALIGTFAATAVAAAPTFSKAAGFVRRTGDIRRIRMYSGRTGESVDMIYWIEGEYIQPALDEISHFMRDWHSGRTKAIDVRAIDIMAASHNLLDTDEAYLLISGYRTAETNEMLRARSGSVAKNSLHVKGMAADLRLKSRTVNQMARAALACGAGGVGRYTRSNFVHMDCGPVRKWGS